MIKYLESNNDNDEFIVLIDGYVAGELSSEQYDEFKYMFHLHPKKIAEESSIDVCDEFEYQENESSNNVYEGELEDSFEEPF